MQMSAVHVIPSCFATPFSSTNQKPGLKSHDVLSTNQNSRLQTRPSSLSGPTVLLTSDIQLEDPGTHTATTSFLYLLVPPLNVFHSTLEQSLSRTVCLSLSLRTLI